MIINNNNNNNKRKNTDNRKINVKMTTNINDMGMRLNNLLFISLVAHPTFNLKTYQGYPSNTQGYHLKMILFVSHFLYLICLC